ncbi:hypothetical protein Tco_1507612 [Tanacetum coccineum]
MSLITKLLEILSTDERIAQKLNEEEMEKAAAREETVKEFIEKGFRGGTSSDNIIKDIKHSMKKASHSEIKQGRKMMIYLKNMAGYKMGYFKGMSYDKIRPMFEKEYNKIQTLFQKDTKVEKTKTKRVAEETLLQESFKKLRTAEASSSEPIQEQPLRTKEYRRRTRRCGDSFQ